MSKVERSLRAPCFSRFILLESLSDTLLVVLVLDMIAIVDGFAVLKELNIYANQYKLKG